MRLRLESLGRTLALLWAGFWTVLFIVESWAWHTPVLVAAPWVTLGLLFAFLVFVAWRWELTGGALLITAGLVTAVLYTLHPPAGLPLTARVTTAAMLGGPPVLAGALFLVDHWRAAARP